MPDAINPAVTQANIHDIICIAGWSRTVRPPERRTYRIKRHHVLVPGGSLLRQYALDHLVPREFGGTPDYTRNLWIEPRSELHGWNARR